MQPVFSVRPRDLLMPPRLREDIDPPHAIYFQGELHCEDFPAVGIVGSRRCTGYGRRIAERFGYELTRNGISVVSGLALGIDAAAHEGAKRAWEDGGGLAPPTGVVAGGLDHVYPRRNKALWEWVGETGALISEYPCETPSEPWRFPRRNRLIAALCDVLVVVESTRQSGTRHTVDAALERDRTVMAVPGPITSPQSEGTNQLLREGCAPVCDVDDILVALSLESSYLGPTSVPEETTYAVDEDSRLILDALDFSPISSSRISEKTGLSFTEVTSILCRLEQQGLIVREFGGWKLNR